MNASSRFRLRASHHAYSLLVACAVLLTGTGFGAIPSASTGDAGKPLSKGEATKRWKAAREDFKKAVQKKDFSAALSSIDQAVQLSRVFGEDDTRRVETLYDAGVYRAYLEQHKPAVPLLEEALRLHTARKKFSDLPKGVILRALACSEAEIGRLDEAERHVNDAVAIFEMHAGKYAEHTADTLDDAAWVHLLSGKVAEGRALASRALRIYEKPLGKIVATQEGVVVHNRWADAGDVARMLNNLALFALSDDDKVAAEASLRRALKLVQQRAGRNPSSILASAEANLGFLFLALDRPQDAIQEFERAREHSQQARGPNHPWTKAIEARLFLARGVAGSWGQPEGIQVMIDQLEPLLPPNDALLSWPVAAQAMLALHAKDEIQLLRFVRVMKTLDRQGEAGPATFLARRLANHAQQLAREGQVTNALEWVNQAVLLARPNLGKFSPQWDPILAVQARLLLQVGKQAETEKVLRTRVTLLDRADAGSGARLAAALEDLANVLANMSPPTEADALKARARQLRAPGSTPRQAG